MEGRGKQREGVKRGRVGWRKRELRKGTEGGRKVERWRERGSERREDGSRGSSGREAWSERSKAVSEGKELNERIEGGKK